MKRLFAILLVFTAGAVVTNACGQTSSPTLPDQTRPSIQPTVERLTGTVPVGGIDTRTFTVIRSNGNLGLVFAASSPPAGVAMGIGLGTPNGTSCSVATSGIVTPSALPIYSAAVNAGTYCLVIGDVGQATGPVTYTIEVSHY